MFWFFGHEACGILVPQPEIEPALPALEGEVLTTGPPGKSHFSYHKSSELSTLSFCSVRGNSVPAPAQG